ncbi:uncharacterized protein MONBRDRAFT_6255 [Monosiga brevicollis MX1]|uniref:Peptidase S9 prolyl oligopeptidase catalytic domain-containing protein n=1 Tax=Monosiga brevicollis TaxID=81824 RepID=A9UTA4_MONBE|nr:uncharacterized protein MONBRDRAFT_6255 [Monosiga brevicollis MX1]EDQ91211.1 predicted protein [Monosiga brevicollis MX1]|eukprot:XP_001743633.1 hypothetical protein [Monosiga brevicollis MX1]
MMSRSIWTLAILLMLVVSPALGKFVCAADNGVDENPGTYATPIGNLTHDQWLEKRREVIAALFGNNGTLPTASDPVLVESVPGPQAAGCLCSTLGHCEASECVWGNNMTKLVWSISASTTDGYTLTLNSTVFYTLNTSGVAPLAYPPYGPPEMPGGSAANSQPATGRGKTLVLFHNGHSQPCTNDEQGCVPDFDGSVDWLNQLGYDVMSFQMPLFQCNAVPNVPCQHAWFQQYADRGMPTMRFFVEPVVRAINYARDVLKYERIAMMGLSGGGFTTTVLGAIDPRIQLSIPVAGSIPCDFNHSSWDFEQYCDDPWAMVLNYTGLYVLAGLEEGRTSVQVLHEQVR